MNLAHGKTHVVIGDCQVKEGVPTAHLGWIGRFIVEQFAGRDVEIINLGDFWDMPSLSSYDKGKRSMEGRRYKADIQAGNAALKLLTQPLLDYNVNRRKKGKAKWNPGLWMLRGNHEERIERAIEDDAQLEGIIGYHDFNDVELGWKPVPFREILWLDGVAYSHYFYNPRTGKPYGGENLYARLKTIGHSFTMGHQQMVDHAMRHVGQTRQHGLVNGTCYLHDEGYLGPQGNNYWRGIVVCHQVENGSYDPMFTSLEYLCRRYEGKTLAQFMTTCA